MVPAIRAGRLEDARALARAQRASALAAFRDIFPAGAPKPAASDLEEEWVRLVEDPAAVVLVAETRHVVGGGAGCPDNNAPSGWILDRLYVHPDNWGRGVGRRLHNAMLEACAELGLHSINLWVLEDNEKARTIYERWDWRLVPSISKSLPGGSVTEVMYEREVLAR